ncbi:MAG: glycosyltransferase family 39 protein, partial [Gemmatimonadales bacterium]
MTLGARADLTESDRPWSRPSLVALALVIAVGLALGWASRFGSLTIYGDDAVYLTLSHSLAAGHYRDEFLVGTPPHAQYPPVMAIYLLLVRLVAGSSLDAALAANLLLLGVTVALVADALRRLTTPWLGVTAAAMVMTSPQIFQLTRELRSEIPFLFFAAIALWCSLVDGERARRGYPAIAIAAALAAFLTRSAGIALIPAIGWAFLLRRTWRPLVLGGSVWGAIVLAWFGYTRWATARTVGHSYANDFLAPPAAHGGLLSHVASNAKVYFAKLAAVQFAIPDIHGQPLDNAVEGLLLVAAILAGCWLLRKRWAALVAYLLCSTAILLVLPWPVMRLVSVLLPWLMLLLLYGVAALASRAGIRRSNGVAVIVGVVIAGLGVRAQIAEAQVQTACRATAPFVDPGCYTPEDRGYAAAALFARDSLPTGAVVAASKPAIFYVLSQRSTLPLELFAQSNASRLLAPAGPATALLLSWQYP